MKPGTTGGTQDELQSPNLLCAWHCVDAGDSRMNRIQLGPNGADILVGSSIINKKMKMNLNLGGLWRNVMKRNRVNLPEWSCGVYFR